MGDVTIIDNNQITMVLHEETGTLHHTINQPMEGAPLRAALDRGVDVLREYGVVKWLSDDRKNAIVSEADAIWSVTDWGPRAVQAGWKYWGLVVPETVAGQASMTEVVNTYYELGVRVMVFTDVEEAQRWLNQF